MRSERWARVDRLLARALARPAEARAAFVAAACGGDRALEREVLRLLEADCRAETFLERPLVVIEAGDTTLGDGRHQRPPAAAAEERIGPYRLVRLLGHGGMGSVYLAERDDRHFRRRVAIKVVAAGGSELRARLRTERQVLARLVHPHIARLYDGGTTDDGRPYLVMEHVEGVPIDVYCRRHRLSVDERLALLRTVCLAVQYAHQNLLVHRDLKPANILVTADGTPKLLDFGIAKLLDAERFGLTVEQTRPGLQPMTPSYASPEQVLGEAITTATDVYALGLLLHRLLTGTAPYRPASDLPGALEQAILEAEPVRPSDAAPPALRRRLRGDLDTIVAKALDKRPEARYGTAQELADDIDRHLAHRPLVARPPALGYRLAKYVRRNALALAAAAVVASLLLVVAVQAHLQSVRLGRARDIAESEQARAEQVSDFMIQLFEQADPGAAQGEELTVGALLERGVEELAALEGQPELQAAQLRTIGRVYHALGRFDRAEALLREALALLREVHGDRHLAVAEVLGALGILLQDSGAYADAEAALRESLAIRRARLGPDHRTLAGPVNNLALLLHHRGDYAAAEPLYREALASMRRHGAEPGSEVLGNLAALLHDKGDYQAAETFYRQAIAADGAALGEQHPQVMSGYNNLAVLLTDMGDYEAAEPLYRKTIAWRTEVLGPRHPSLYRTVSNLARLHHERGDYEAAETLYRQALEHHRAVLGNEHPWVARTLSQLGKLYHDLGDPARAREHFEQALALQRRLLGDRHRRLAETLAGLARLELAQGEGEAAEAASREALAIFRAKLVDGHWQIRYAESLLAASLDRRRAGPALAGDEDPETMMIEGYRALRRQVPRSPATRDVRDLLASYYRRHGREQEARALLRAAA